MKKCPKCGVEYSEATTLCPADGVALETTNDALIGATLAEKYRIDARINEGGMGSVYRGTHILMDKTVAIKVLRPSLAADEKIVARFSREARAASKILHPNAISVTDIGEDHGTVFLVMEFLSGKTLKHVIRDEGPMPLRRIVEITRQVGDALASAHAQGVVHRDLKSDNIMLLDTTSGDHAKVLDFGIAKIIEPEGKFDGDLTAPNLVIGTPQYMSPEQCSQDSEIDSRSDIYSLGVILFEMLVGHVPFSGESATIVMMKHLQDPVPSVMEERNDVPPPVARVVARAMAKVADNRYQTVGELIEDLTIASGMIMPVPVPPPTNAAATNAPASTLGSVLGLSSVNDDADEVTVVRPREVYPTPPAQTSGPRRSPVTVPVHSPRGPMPAAGGFNPWKILVPAGIAVLVIFGAFYAWTKISPASSNSQNTNQPVQTLSPDPNSQPVQPAQPPTGKAEQGLPSGGSVNPAANVNASPNANAAEIQTPIADISPTANENANANSNTNANANRKPSPLPEPTRSVVPNVPPPSPAATKPPAPTPSP